MSTVARLREVLADYFGAAEARTALLRLREHDLLPSGTHGRCGSAAITVQQAALALLALASGAEPRQAPAEAQRLAAYRLKAMFLPVVGVSHRRPIDSKLRFGDWSAGELCHAAVDPAYRLEGWQIEPGFAVFTIAPSEFDDDAQLRDVAQIRSALSFQPELGGIPAVRRLCILPPTLIASVAALFRQARAEAA